MPTNKQTQGQPANTQPEESQEERVRRRAYELYEKRGKTDGQHEDDWHTAEKEILPDRKDKNAA